MKRNVILFDLDHTLFDASPRDHMIFEAMHTGRWDEYHANSVNDEAAHDAVELYKTFKTARTHEGAPAYELLGITARPEKWRPISEASLKRINVELDDLLMRPEEDYRPSGELKLELAEKRFGGRIGERVLFIIDDHPDVCRAFQQAGVTALQILGRSYHG